MLDKNFICLIIEVLENVLGTWKKKFPLKIKICSTFPTF